MLSYYICGREIWNNQTPKFASPWGDGIPAGQRVQPGEKHPPKRDGDTDRGRAVPHQQRIPGGHPTGRSGLWGNEGIHWDAIHDGELHGKLRPHHRHLYGHVPGRPGDRPRGGDPGLHRDQAAGDRGGKDRGTKASGGGSQAGRRPMVDQRAGGLRGHCHNRGGDRGEQVCQDDADEITNEAAQSPVYTP